MKEIIVIIGGGIAGMEAAGQLLRLGYSPIIIEKSDKLGGHVAKWNRLFPDMTPAEQVISQLTDDCNGANIFLNTEISFINRLSQGIEENGDQGGNHQNEGGIAHIIEDPALFQGSWLEFLFHISLRFVV